MRHRPGHRRGCRCVGCSPRTRARGLRAARKTRRRGGARRNPTRGRGELGRLENVLRTISGRDFYVERAYGQPRLYETVGQGDREISPRLPHAKMVLWLEAFIYGYDEGRKVGNVRYDAPRPELGG